MGQNTWATASELQRRLPDRLAVAVARYRRGGRRSRLVRQFVATSLIAVAAVLASLTPPTSDDGTTVLATTRDLAIGTMLESSDLAKVNVRSPPLGYLAEVADVLGRALTSDVRRGEVLTDVRVLDTSGPHAGAGRAAVPITLTDDGVITLLRPGVQVTIVSVSTGRGAVADDPVHAITLVEDAVVLSVSEIERAGAVVLFAVPQQVANQVTAAAVAGTIALRFG